MCNEKMGTMLGIFGRIRSQASVTVYNEKKGTLSSVNEEVIYIYKMALQNKYLKVLLK